MTQEQYTDTIPVAEQDDPVVAKEFNYQWDNASRLTSFEDPAFGATPQPNTKQTVYLHDNETRTITLERIDQENPTKTNAETYRYELDNQNRIKRLVMPDAAGTLTSDTEYAFNVDFIAIDYTYTDSGRISSIHVQDLISGDSLYYISYSFDANGRNSGYTVREVPGAGSSFKYRSRIYYDGRGQIISEIYSGWDDTNKAAINLSEITNTYDLAGNLKTKEVIDSTYAWSYTYTYDTGYRIRTLVVACTDGTNNWTFTYTPSHDYRGNLSGMICTVFPAIPTPPTAPIDLPSTMSYDSYGRMVEYTYGTVPNTKTAKLWYDPLGRVFRRELINDFTHGAISTTHYYYKGSQIVQEYDFMLEEVGEEYQPKDDLTFDYLRAPSGKVVRRREVTDLDTEDWDDYLHFNDAQGTAKNENKVERGVTPPEVGYAVSAAGEPLAVASGAPTHTNHIQWQGAFLEDTELTTSAGSDRGNLYRMGVRHYSPAYGRFLQRDPLNNYRMPNASMPLAHNPYQYGYNQATEYSDTSGYACCGLGGGGAVGGSGGYNKESNAEVACKVNWADETCPGLYTCLSACCVWPSGQKDDPCHSLCLPIDSMPQDQWTRCECLKSCDTDSQGGENHPRRMGVLYPDDMTPGWEGPPSFGPGGTGGNIWWWWPILMGGDHFPHFSMPLRKNNEVANISTHLHQSQYIVVHATPSPMIGGWSWGINESVITLVTAAILDWGAIAYCEMRGKVWDCNDTRGEYCIGKACCALYACLANSGIWVLAGIGLGILYVLASGGTGLIPILAGGLAGGSVAVGIMHTISSVPSFPGCTIVFFVDVYKCGQNAEVTIEELRTRNPECF